MVRWIVAAMVAAGATLGVQGADKSVERGGGSTAEPWPELRIDSQLSVGKERLESQSLFDAGRVYEYLDRAGGAGEVTIFEPAEKRFTLLHVSQKLACEVSFAQIEGHLKEWRTKTAQAVEQLEGQGDEGLRERARLGRWLLDPQFAEEYQAGSRELKLASPYLVYQVQGAAMDGLQGGPSGATRQGTDALATALRSYWDWYACLNHLLNPQALPPQARMVVNAKLAEHRIVPVEVELNVLIGGKTTLRTTHKTRLGLGGQDRQRLAQTRRGLSEARRVSLEEYLRETSR